MKYNKKEYLKMLKQLEEDFPGLGVQALDFKTWKEVKPIADQASGLFNKIIKSKLKGVE